MYVCKYVSMSVCMYACVRVYMHVCMYVCMRACLYVRMLLCMYVCMYVCTYVCAHVCVYMCMYDTCLCVYVYVCKYRDICDARLLSTQTPACFGMQDTNTTRHDLSHIRHICMHDTNVSGQIHRRKDVLQGGEDP